MTGQITLFNPRNEPDTFKKAVQVLHAKPLQSLSLLQRKMLNSWLKNAGNGPSDADGWWELRIDKMAVEIDFNSNNRAYLKESAEQLMRIVFQWDVVAAEAKRVKWKASVLFPDVEILTEVVRYRISDQLLESVLSPDIYALIDQSVIRKYSRNGSIGIYEHCKRFSRIGKTTVVKWEDFRDVILGASKDFGTYAEYKHFKNKVLVPCIREVNTEGAIKVELQEIKNGRSVVGIFFTVSEPRGDITTVAMTDESIELISKMVKLGVPPSEAKRLVTENSASAVATALLYTNERKANKKAEQLTNSAAYFRKALREKWAPAGGTHVVTDVVDKFEAATSSEKQDVSSLFKLHQMAEAEEYFKQLDIEDQTSAIEKYNAQQTTGSLMIKPKPTRASQVAFQQWLIRDLWGVPDPAQLLQFADHLLRKQTVQSKT